MVEIPNEYLSVLEFLTKKLLKVHWVLVGSLSLALQGVNIRPKDIDILTDKAGALKCNELLKDFCLEPIKWSKTDTFASYFGKFRIKNLLVEIMGDLEIKDQNTWRKIESRLKAVRSVQINDIRVPVSPLKEQLESYQKLNREKDRLRVQLIKEKLDNQRDRTNLEQND